MPRLDQTNPRALVGLAAAFFGCVWGFRLLRTWHAPLEQVVAQTPDDAYYYLAVARHIAEGLGSTYDGLQPTNGYHFGWLLVCTALARVLHTDGSVESLGLLLRSALTVQLVLGAVAAALLADTARRILRSPAATAGVWIASASPWMIYGMTDGMESGLALLAICLLLNAAVRWDLMLHVFASGRVSVRRAAAFGILLAIVVAARLDLILLVAAIGGFLAGLRSERFARRLGLAAAPSTKRLLCVGFAWFGPVLLLLGAFLTYNQVAFGSAVPISIALKSTFPNPGWNPQWLSLHAESYVAVFFLATWGFTRYDDPARPASGRALLVVGAGFLALHALHTLIFLDWAVMRWHFTAYWPIVILAAADTGCALAARVPPRFVVASVTTILVSGSALALVAQHRFFTGRTDRVFQAQSFRAALWAREHIPADAVLAMSDCGVFGYFRGGLVTNLDGVVNTLEYQRAIRDDAVRGWLARYDVRYLASHFVPDSTVSRGYHTLEYRFVSHYYRRRSSGIKLSETAEVYRGDPYPPSGRTGRFLIWEMEPLPEVSLRTP